MWFSDLLVTMLWVAITGGIGTGKTMVADILRQRGYRVIDADELARRAVEKNSLGLKSIVETFSKGVLAKNGELDRKKLGRMVFSDSEKLQKLEDVVHPIVQRLAQEEKQKALDEGLSAAFYDVPLLFEKNLKENFDKTICVYARPELQIERVIHRSGLEREDVEMRMSKQIPIADKCLMADLVIVNEGSLSDLEFAINEALEKLNLPHQAQE